MLPPPGTMRRPPAGAYALPLSGSAMSLLRQRTRLTNLAVGLLFLILSFSLLANISHAIHSHAPAAPFAGSEWTEVASPSQLESHRPPSVETTIKRDPRMKEVDHLVLVPGHAVWLGTEAARAESNDDWILEEMQRGGSVRTYVKHVRRAAEILESDPHALLVFSGGATRSHLTSPFSEALSYHRLAAGLGLLPSSPDTASTLPPSARATTEEYALDSYENLLFSIARFREVTGRWPAKITVVGYGMKQRRFEQLHRGAIRFTREQFTYIGIDDEGDTTEHFLGELKHGYAPFLFSPSGCRPPLSAKRASRNPFARYPPYHSSTPELQPLLEWCPPLTPVGEVAVPASLRDAVPDMAPPEGFVVFDGHVPWEDGGGGGGGGEGGAHFGREKD